jgi:hypothetical protein
MNVECRMLNVEVRYSVFFIKSAEGSETALRYSAVRCSINIVRRKSNVSLTYGVSYA